MKHRKLTDGREVEEFDNIWFLSVKTKCPQKYKLVDMETGEAYEGNHPNNNDGLSWKKIND